jgi:hypothetical protein
MNAAYSIFDRQFGNIFDRGAFLRKAYAILATQFTFFFALSALLVYIPHLRRVFRKLIFDKLFLTSSVGFPLIFVLLFLSLFEQFRRRFAIVSMLLLTSCLSYLLSYVLTMDDCRTIMYQVVGMDLSILSCIGISSQLPRFTMRNLKQASFLPIVLSAYNLTLMKATSNYGFDRAWKYWLGSSAVVSYLGYNTVSVLNSDTLLLQKNEYPFAATSFYLNFDLFKSITGLFRGSSRNAYESI